MQIQIHSAEQVEIEVGKISLEKRGKLLHLVRHAHGVHNAVGEVNYDDYKLEVNEDAVLTDLGVSQCKELSEAAAALVSGSKVLLVSPMRRTLETAQYSFPSLIGKVPWIALESLREQTGAHPCDRRRPKSELSVKHPHVDFSQVMDELDPLYWNYPTSREPSEEVSKRCRDLLRWVLASDYEELVIVTHSAYLRHLLAILSPEANQDPQSMDHFKNCELRSLVVCGDLK